MERVLRSSASDEERRVRGDEEQSECPTKPRPPKKKSPDLTIGALSQLRPRKKLEDVVSGGVLGLCLGGDGFLKLGFVLELQGTRNR